jgi:hydroxyethylthiazole kinase
MHDPGALQRSNLPNDDLPQAAAAILERLRTRAPKVHCITNSVAQNFTANALLAAGCVPSMTLSLDEIAAFVARSDALLVNLGTFDRERREATKIAIATAAQHNLPWLLDPVFIDRAPPRAAFARHLMASAPKAVRLNHAEFSALADTGPSPAGLAAYARLHKTALGLSGQTDMVTDGERFATIANGHPLMAKVTAMGCAGSALAAACLAVEPDAFRATVAALVIAGVAGEVAAQQAQGPASFAVAIIDALHNLDGEAVAGRAKVELAKVAL